MYTSFHQHYSPYQWATGVQVSNDDVNVFKIRKVQSKLTAKDTAKAKVIPTTMPVDQAHAVIFAKSPNAFISPNSVGAMKDIKAVFGCGGSY